MLLPIHYSRFLQLRRRIWSKSTKQRTHSKNGSSDQFGPQQEHSESPIQPSSIELTGGRHACRVTNNNQSGPMTASLRFRHSRRSGQSVSQREAKAERDSK